MLKTNRVNFINRMDDNNDVRAACERDFAEPTLVIGVKSASMNGGTMYDLEVLLQRCPQLQVVKRFPDTFNPNYLTAPDEHILQTAIIQYVKEKK